MVFSLIERISRRSNCNTNQDGKNSPLKVSISSSPPIEALLEEVDKHYNLRQQFSKITVGIRIANNHKSAKILSQTTLCFKILNGSEKTILC